MLNISKHIKIDEDTINSPNLCDRFDTEDLKVIGEKVWDFYQTDLKSREPWIRRTEAAMDLAMQVQKDKTFPWPGCSNVAFPLITIAALQFHSRAYPAIVQAPDLVNCRVVGPDPDGQKTERASRVSTHMSWQLLEQDESWEEETDRALLHIPIVGCAFKKSYYSPGLGRNVSEVVLAKDLVINYWAKSVEECGVKTHVIPFSRNKLHERMMEGTFRNASKETWYHADAPMRNQTAYEQAVDNRTGFNEPMPDERTPFIVLEQHVSLDLDGDGYAEPYIVSIDHDSHYVWRIVCRFDRPEDVERTKKGEIIRIKASEYFTKYHFIPSPDGGIYDVGFGVLLGPLNESTNSAINQLFDAGTMANTAGGFLGRGAKIRGGVYNFSPFEWNRVDSTGDDLRKSIFPMPVREPSNVMFQLLSLLINYTEKVSGAVDISTGGNPGQNTPAETSQSMLEQGQKVYAAIFKRIWRSMKNEFKKLYQLNALHMSPDKTYFAGSTDYISRADYLGDPSSVIPAADPNIMSDRARLGQAQTLLAVAKGDPKYNQDEVNIRFLKSIKIADYQKIYVGTKGAPPPKPTEKVQIELIKQQIANSKLEWQRLQWISSLYEQRRMNMAKITLLYAQADQVLKESDGAQAAQKVAEFEAQMKALETMNGMLNDHINNMQQAMGDQDGQGGTGPAPTQGAGGQGSMDSMGGAPGNQAPAGLPAPGA